MLRPRFYLAPLALGLALASFRTSTTIAAEPKPAATTQQSAPQETADQQLAGYFRQETKLLAERCLADIHTLEDWESRRATYHKQLMEMLGLSPLPEKTPLQPVITGRVEHPEFTVEKIHFQSRPGLYVTGNLYLPKEIKEPLPAILYVCGHARVKQGETSLGNKTAYQHHGGWFARNGYVCLTIDTLQLGEIEGTHHGTFGIRNGEGGYDQMWWWNSAGYTPAGVEAWNCIRALDYLQSRKEVDGDRLGVTGRSGGGAYSWWIAAIDDRIKAAVPVAGITDLTNHVVDGCVTGHCDCMYMVNTYRWDYAQVAAMVAPRPLLISNTDKDRIFPLEGVVRVHSQARDIYRLYGKEANLGLQITEGPHLDTQELHIHAFVWFDRFLKQERRPIAKVAEKLFPPEALQVFETLPSDEKNTHIHDTFVARANIDIPSDGHAWQQTREALLSSLKEKSFRGWPSEAPPQDLKEVFKATSDGVELAAYDFTSQHHTRLRLYIAQRAGLDKPSLMVLNTLDEAGWQDFLATYSAGFAKNLASETEQAGDHLKPDGESFGQTQGMFKAFPWAMAYVAPRGIGLTAVNPAERNQTHIRRRYMLLGQTLDGMRVWDTVQAAAALRATPGLKDTQLWLQGNHDMAGVALYASLFTPDVHRLDLHHLAKSHADGGPVFLNVLRVLDMPQAVALAAENSQVRIYQDQPGGWEFPEQVLGKLDWDKKQLQVRVLKKEQENQP